MIHSNKDLYQSINKITLALKESGQPVYAQRLEDALSLSTVPSEILGETRLVLEDIEKADIQNNLNIASEIKASLEYLNHIL